MFHCLKINQLLAPSGRWCFSHMKGFWVTPSWACVFFQGGEDRQAVSVPEHCQVGRSLFQGGCGEHRGPRGGGPRVSLAGGGWGVESGVQCGHRLGTARSLWCWRQEAGGAPTRASHRNRCGPQCPDRPRRNPRQGLPWCRGGRGTVLLSALAQSREEVNQKSWLLT